MLASDMLKTSFPQDAFPALPCPRCGASLQLKVPGILHAECAASVAASDVGAINPEDRVGVFAGMLRCVSANCHEAVSVCGSSFNQVDDSRGYEELSIYLTPHSFVPPVPIFDVPAKSPEPIVKALHSSFDLFWSNPSAAGNALRVAVEHLMDHEAVPQFPKGVRQESKRLNLHNRIEGYYKKTHPDRAELLLAVKWIGNAGSHKAELIRQDLLHGYTIFERVLDEMFNKANHVRLLAKKIVKARGRLKRTRQGK